MADFLIFVIDLDLQRSILFDTTYWILEYLSNQT